MTNTPGMPNLLLERIESGTTTVDDAEMVRVYLEQLAESRAQVSQLRATLDTTPQPCDHPRTALSSECTLHCRWCEDVEAARAEGAAEVIEECRALLCEACADGVPLMPESKRHIESGVIWECKAYAIRSAGGDE